MRKIKAKRGPNVLKTQKHKNAFLWTTDLARTGGLVGFGFVGADEDADAAAVAGFELALKCTHTHTHTHARTHTKYASDIYIFLVGFSL